MKLTVMHQPDDDPNRKQGQKAIKPTVIPSTPPSPAPPTKPALKPTVIRSASSVPTTPTVTTPTAVPGAHRKHLVVTIEQLATLTPGGTPEVLNRAFQLVLALDANAVDDRTALFWGQDLQKRYSDLLTESLDLVQTRALETVNRYVARMQTILSSIHLRRVCGLEKRSGKIFGLFGGGEDDEGVNTLSQLTTARRELNELIKKMSAKVDQLMELKDKLGQVARGIEGLNDEVTAATMAATFLAEYFRQHPLPDHLDLADRFQDRAMSLAQTLEQIRSSESMRAAQIDQPLRLIAAVQQVALVAVPGWLGSIVSLKAALDSKEAPSVTEVDDLSEQLHGIVEQLQAKGA